MCWLGVILARLHNHWTETNHDITNYNIVVHYPYEKIIIFIKNILGIAIYMPNDTKSMFYLLINYLFSLVIYYLFIIC